MELSKYIKEILISRDNVIIPNFGAFEKAMLSARIDTNTGEMHPPQIGVIFNGELKIDSGILIKYIAEKEGTSEDKVAEEIQGQVQIWESALNLGQQVLLAGIGTLVKDSSGNINFDSSITASDFPESYGLPVINIKEKSVGGKPVEKKEAVKIEEKKEPVKKTPVKQKETKIPEKVTSPKSNKKLVVALFIAVPIIAVIVLGVLNFDFVKQKYNKASHFVSGMLPNNNKTDSIKNNSIVVVDSLSINDSVEIETKTFLENNTIIDGTTNTKIALDSEDLNTIKKVHIISGSFKIKSFANRQRNILVKKGFKAEVLPENNGLFRVSVSSYDNVESAAKDFDKVKAIDDNINYWILVNK